MSSQNPTGPDTYTYRPCPLADCVVGPRPNPLTATSDDVRVEQLYRQVQTLAAECDELVSTISTYLRWEDEYTELSSRELEEYNAAMEEANPGLKAKLDAILALGEPTHVQKKLEMLAAAHGYEITTPICLVKKQ